ncbi:MAG: NAD(P)H-dependent oxidoreductase [Verrucomicrobiota bacterium JB023]|nr:NAD(P)H-dependent oxidoreductase [Verrucomicrobiota bacterium JB023]
MPDNTSLIDHFNWRYATKVFDATRKVNDADLATLEEALRLTPSSFGLQPWHFLIVTDEEIREKLLPLSWNQKQVTECSHYFVLCTRTDVDVDYIDRFVSEIANDRGTTIEELQGYRDVMVDFVSRMPSVERLTWATRQTYLALQRLMDTAALLEIDACPMEGFSAPQYDEVLQLSEKNLTASVCCAIGYRSAEDKYASLAKSRFPKEEVISYL